jgi:hypothetical protein
MHQTLSTLAAMCERGKGEQREETVEGMEPTGGVRVAVRERRGERGWAGFGRLLGCCLVWAPGAAQLAAILSFSFFFFFFLFSFSFVF